jgi:dienelactone hydrolase
MIAASSRTEESTMKRTLSRVLMVMLAMQGAAASAAMVEKTIEYQVGDETMESTLLYDDSVKAVRPGLVFFPNWRGANAAAIEKAKAIAGKDYVVLVADVFGKGVRPADDKASGALVGPLFKDFPTLRARGNAAYAELEKRAGNAPLQSDRIGAIGFCFGGGVALEIARSGTPLAAVVTFHGQLASYAPVPAGKAFVPAVLVLNGAEDSYVSKEDIAGFEKEMNDVNADWQFHNYAGAVHCFSEADAQNPPGCVYNKRAADRAYRQMRDFLGEQFTAQK